jgi:hypothetical protein
MNHLSLLKNDLKKKIVQQYLGAFLKDYPETNVDIAVRTGILPSRISKMSNPDRDTIKANEFYLIALALKADIDEMANHVFTDYKLQLKDGNIPVNTELTKFGQYLSEGLILKKTVSSKTAISQSRLSTLSTDKNTIPLAKEVYLTALAINGKPSDAFKFIYGHLKLNSEEKQTQLRNRLKEKDAVAREKIKKQDDGRKSTSDKKK